MTSSASIDRPDGPPPIRRDRLLDRFLRYVQIGTTADPDNDEYPSSPGQRKLGALLTEELRALPIDGVHQDEHSLVWASIPATDGGGSAAVALLAHLDTSPESPGEGVRPQLIERYAGGDIHLENGRIIRADQVPELNELVGMTLITTDGSTLLGGDDKAGVAILMELAAHLVEHPQLPHGPVRLLFTCDEEIGRGTDKIDLKKLDADVGYTLDGGGAGELDVETFSADAAKVTFTGHNLHPAIAKDRMVNAVRAAADFVSRLPRHQRAPEATAGREGFLHPYRIEGGVAQAMVHVLLRTFDTPQLESYAEMLRQAADAAAAQLPGVQVEVEVTPQYRNLADGLRQRPEATELAMQAFVNLGRPCRQTIIRGGTDGSRLTEKGLPTPNLSSGQHNLHALEEFACLDEMVAALEHLIELLRLWSERSRS